MKAGDAAEQAKAKTRCLYHHANLKCDPWSDRGPWHSRCSLTTYLCRESHSSSGTHASLFLQFGLQELFSRNITPNQQPMSPHRPRRSPLPVAGSPSSTRTRFQSVFVSFHSADLLVPVVKMSTSKLAILILKEDIIRFSHVHRVNSKATLRISLDQLFPLVPTLLHSHLYNSRYYAEKTNSLLIQADDSRKQSDNTHSCFVRLHSLILEAGSRAIPGETSAAQREHVRDLQKAENERRLRGKKFASGKKAGRRAGRSDE